MAPPPKDVPSELTCFAICNGLKSASLLEDLALSRNGTGSFRMLVLLLVLLGI